MSNQDGPQSPGSSRDRPSSQRDAGSKDGSSAGDKTSKQGPRRRTSRLRNQPDQQHSEKNTTDHTSGTDESESSYNSEQLERRGIGLRSKLILLVLVAQIFAAAFIYFMVRNLTEDTLRKRIDKGGIGTVRMLGQLKPSLVKQFGGVSDKPSSQLKRAFMKQATFPQQLLSLIEKHGSKEVANKVFQDYDGIQKEIFTRIDNVFDQLSYAGEGGSKNGFLSVLRDDKTSIEIINFRYLDAQGQPEPSIYRVPAKKISLARQGTVRSESTDDYQIEISQGEINETPVRIYELTKPLPDSDRKYQVMLALSAKEISQATGQLTYTLLLVTLLSIVFGGAAGWLFSGQIIKPINALLDDINQVSKGDLDHRTVPQSSDEIGIIARTFNRMTESLKEAQKRELEAKAMEHELNIAMEVQGELLPEENPDLANWDLGSFYRPSKEVGGDYYDFIQIDEDHLGMVVADVSGKGVPGSLVMTMTRAMIRMEASRNLSTKETLIRTNRMLSKDIREGMFVTCMYAILDIPESRLRISSAGHNPMVLWRQNEKQIRTVNPNGIALGFDDGPLFERTIVENVIEINEGDRIVLYTDGIVEAMNPEDEELGEEEFFKQTAKFAQKDSDEFTKGILARIEEHQKDAEQHDDITILTARRIT
jgi:serine phosphatase RsbU (regulator of sigma subunit)